MSTFRARGANPVAKNVKELYSALEQRVVDGQENPYTVISASRFGEMQKHLSNNGHFFEFVFFFQAEDGIRHHCVTGVQTCALPISLIDWSHRGPRGAEVTTVDVIEE